MTNDETTQDATVADATAVADEQAAATTTTMPLTATDPPAGQHYWWGTGRRKRAIARVRIRPGSGAFKVNGRDVDEFFTQQRDRIAVRQPLDATKMVESWDIWANASGGGYAGQAEAVRLGLARAIARAVPETDSPLRDRQLLTRDARKTERKKYGRRGARRSFQFSKR